MELDAELNDAPATSASIVFKRFVAPKQLNVIPLDPQPDATSSTVVFHEGDSFEVSRPRLGYPALLFTEMATNDAFQRLLDDRALLHTGKTGIQRIKGQRAVSYFDPDVDQLMVIVELRSLLLDMWWGSGTADFFFDTFVPAGLSLENLKAEKKNAIGTMLTAVREDISQLPRILKAQRRDMDRLAVSVSDAAFMGKLD